MPFIGQDWRSPGEVWVKTDEGWERMKVLERSLCKFPRSSIGLKQLNHQQCSDDGVNDVVQDESSSCDCGGDFTSSGMDSGCVSFTRQELDPPYCPITLKSTKEVAGYNIISEAFYLLDFSNAIKDIRRFNYVCKLLHLLITQNLTSLSGCATKVFFHMLEEVAWQVSSSQQNIHVLHTLLNDLKDIMKNYYCWGRPLGSTLLWQQHLRSIEKICQMVNQIKIKEPSAKDGPSMSDLPEELIREILLRLSDYRDLASSGESSKTMASILNEQHIWRQLCKYHFTKQQMRHVLGPAISANGQKDFMKLDNIDWEQLFHKLRKKYGLREEYADSLFLCRQCRCLFWKSFGHPCLDNRRQVSSPPKSPPVEQRKPPLTSEPSTSSASSIESSSSSRNVSGQSSQQPQQQQPQQQQFHSIHGQLGHIQLRRVVQNGEGAVRIQHRENEVNNGNNGPNNPNPAESGNNSANKENDQDSLVPLHIPVPPQAFLKFFSL